jgi:hypothetical protein
MLRPTPLASKFTVPEPSGGGAARAARQPSPGRGAANGLPLSLTGVS